ncbi:MAG TPA: hypothetical protein VIG99_28830 [Myxococcaceae bacterium]
MSWIAAATCALLAQAPAAGYEQQLVAWGLEKVQREVEPSPEGKRVEEILVASEDIVARTDPYPQLLNLVHVRTRESVVRAEVLLQVGEPYRAQLAAESERNLRKLFILATAVVLPVKARDPDAVGLLVITKDLWSIRLNSEFSLVEGTLLQLLRIRPTEQNFLGLNKRLSLDFFLKLDTVSLGEVLVDERFLGSDHRLVQSARVIFNRQTGALEGSQGEAALQLPLRTLDAARGYTVRASWLVQRARVFRGANISQIPYPDATAPQALLPYVYDERSVSGSATHTWSFGRAFKTNLIALAAGFVERTNAPAEEGLTPEQQVWLGCNYFPRNQQAVYAGAAVQAYEARYAVLRNVRTFAISEDFQLGHSLVAEAHWAPLQFAEAGMAAQYRWLGGDDLLTLAAGATARYQPGDLGCGDTGGWVNQRVGFEVNNVGPLWTVGRLAVRLTADLRWNDLNHRPVYLGGSNGLRGLLAEQLAGSQLLLWNAEFRTVPINLFTLHAGLVLFWDAGAAFDSPGELPPPLVHTVGVGLRALFPQFDKEPVRIDFGYVISGANNPVPLRRVSASFGQVDEIRPAILSSPFPP